MKILLIGGNGYIGSKLYKQLKNKQYNVDNLDLCWYGKIYDETIVKNYDDLTKQELEKYTHIILLAGFSSVGMCKDLYKTVKNNITYFSNLVEKLNSEQVLIYASSCSVYGNGSKILTENDKLESPLNNYDFSKQALDYITNLSINKRCVGLRFGTVNGYSPNLRTDLVINAMTLSSLEQNKIFVSNGNIRRSLLGIDDLCNAIEKIVITKNIKSDVYNIISCSYAIVELAKKIQSINGCELVVNDSLSTSYSFTVTNEKFESEFKFKFVDTVDSIYRNLINNIDQIKIKSNRTNLPSCYV
jgi:nucleoside-diphosphate-sugar epimerase